MRVADLTESTSTSQGRKSILESNSSNCSDEHSIFNLSQAIARIENEVQANQFAGSTKGQCCLKHLRKSISDKINKSELLSIQSQRPSVITPTPPGSPKDVRASTPLITTHSILPNSRSCFSFGQIDLHIPPNSPTCSEISSIGGEVFEAELTQSIPKVEVSMSAMEQAEDLVDETKSKLELRMNLYTPSHLNSVNMDLHASEIQKTQEILENLSEAIRKLIKKFSPQLGQERVSALKTESCLFEEKFVVYRESFGRLFCHQAKPSVN